MDRIESTLLTALENYFEVLKYKGYVNDRQLENLLLLCCIVDFIEMFHCHLSDDDIYMIDNVLNCLSKDCLIPDTTSEQLMQTENHQLDYSPTYNEDCVNAFGSDCNSWI